MWNILALGALRTVYIGLTLTLQTVCAQLSELLDHSPFVFVDVYPVPVTLSPYNINIETG